MGNQEREFRQLKILSLDGSEIYKKMHPLSGEAMLKVKKDNDKIDANKLKGYLDESLDTVYLERIYSKYKENLLTKKFRFSGNCTLALVNVSFDYAIKEFSKKGNAYVRNGYEEQVEWDKFEDHLFVIEDNGQPLLIAIEIPKESKRGDNKYAPVEVPRLELLGDYFIYDEKKRAYAVSKGKRDETKIPTAIKKDDIRKDLYKNGFVIDNVKYVRYKRSAGSSRDGQCLFIAEPLYEPMMTWSSCGLDGNSVDDQASWQAYISLTLSSIEDRIYIPKKAILIIKDQESVFDEDAVNVSADGESLCAKRKKVEIKNKIWDGEALLDVSVFEENGYADNGMLLLRNRFFKTCAFNTNLQQWFRDKGIKDLSQLSGHYYKDAPRRIEDIKLVITESSLKYLKFFDKEKWETGFDQWIENIFDEADTKESKLFGVVKFDHETGPMENQMVNTNYQLLNTLGLTYEDVGALLDQSEIFYKKMQEDPMYLRRYINLYVLAKDEDDPFGKDRLKADSYRQHLLNTMMRLTDNFEFTEFYKSFRKDMCQSFKEHLKFGRIYTEGNYQTILGNGMEFLCAVIAGDYKVDVPLALSDGEVYTERFPDGEKLLCARSPHITMGNLLVATNVHDEQLKKYFNLGKAQAIVCVNAIHSNIQQRLNGCDYDSDTMLVTNNHNLWRVAYLNYGKFGVPVCTVESIGSKTYTTAPEHLAELDMNISENRIGEIVNLSQFLNSLYWDSISNGATHEQLQELYVDICKLAVLSGMEIDKAKRSYAVKSVKVLADLQKYKKEFKGKHGNAVPEFFAFITENQNAKTSSDAKLNTTMSYIYDIVNSKFGKAKPTADIPYSKLFHLTVERNNDGGNSYKKKRVLEIVEKSQKELSAMNYASKNKSRSEKQYAKDRAQEVFLKCISDVSKHLDNDHVYDLLLQELDAAESSKNNISGYHALLFTVLCYSNDCKLMKKVKPSERPVHDLIWVEDAPSRPLEFSRSDIVWIFGHPHVICYRLPRRKVIPKSEEDKKSENSESSENNENTENAKKSTVCKS